MAGEPGRGDAGEARAPAAPLLLEIGSEDIPARFLPMAVAELQARVAPLMPAMPITFEFKTP